jgi:hypothetical protein
MGRHGPADTTRAYPQARAFLSIAGQRVPSGLRRVAAAESPSLDVALQNSPIPR